MRYEDASNSAFQGNEPIARDDSDALPAGTRGPATGNLISGEGTQTGSSGADQATGAHITSIAGKGGEDTSFAGGKLSVAGEFGKLSVDADGNYSYLANGGVENVRDRFVYTLADNQGNSDTAALIVEIGKTPVVIKAGAQQVVPGPDGVVTLPPGVQLSDVMVVGRNLVVNLPDGTQLVIVDGAVFVPQLVLDGVEVPATNLAALLIGQEPQPAAGETPVLSSGGNFDVPVPPLDPGVPLGDLIPPTEYGYIPPEPEDTGQFLDRDPEIFVQPDGQPASVAAVDQVEEAGLPTRNGGEPAGSGESADGNGADNDVTSETTGGTILINSPDGVASVTINGVLVTGLAGQQIAGAFGTLTITGFSGDNILYSYTLNDNTSGNTTHDDFAVVLTDDDGDQAAATLRIDIIDDVPTARPDTDALAIGQNVATGNVLTDASAGDAGDSDAGADTVGADNASITAVSSANVPANSDGSAPFVVNGQYGVLTLQADGNYTYVRNEGTPGGVQDVFNYTLTDGDGDTSSTTLTITIPDATPTLPDPAAVLLDDDALANGNPGGTGDDVDSAGTPGQLAGTGGDGDLDYAFTGTNTLPAGFTVNSVNASTLQILQGGTVVLTITLNNETGAYTVVQNNPIDHPAGLNENNLSFSIGVQVVDADGDTDGATISINVDDDTPIALEAQVTGTVDEDGVPGGIAGGSGDVAGEATVANGSVASLFASGADTPLTFSLLSDTSGLPALTSNGVAVTYSVAGNTLTASAGGNTVFTFTLNADGNWTFTLVDQVDHAAGNNENDLSISLGSLVQATDADGDSVTAFAGGLVITIDDDTPTASQSQVTGTVDEDGVPGGIAGGAGDVAGEATVANGSVASLFNSGADQPLSYSLLSDTSGLPALTSNGVAVTYAVVGNTLTASAGGNTVFTFALNADGSWTFTLVDQLDHAAGGGENDLSIQLGSLIQATDADGDSVTANAGGLAITVDDDTPTVADAQVAGTVDEDGVPGGIAGGSGDVAGEATVANGSVASLFNSGADQPLSYALLGDTSGLPALTSNGVAVTYSVAGNTLTASAGGNTVFTFALNGDGSWTFTLVDQLDHAAGNNENDLTIQLGSLIQATDADGDSVTAGADDLVITVDDDTPTASQNQVTGTVDEDGVPGGIAGGTGDVPGAATVANGSVASLFNSGADQPLSYALLGDTSGLPALTSNGVAVTYSVVGNTLTASAGGNTVFTFVLNANGDWTFTLVDQLDHAAGNNENDLTIQLGSLIQATDADGDSVTANAGGLVITVDDDTPTASTAQVTGVVDEDGVPGGIAGGTGDVAGTATVANGSVATLFNSGADQPLTYALLGNTSGLPALTSNGVAVTYSVVGNTLTASAGGNTVFTFTLNADGNWTFTLVDQLDHAPGANENDLTINLSSIIQATDADGDSVTAGANGLIITVDDDTPTASGAQVTGTVDEDGVPGGIAGGPDDVAGAATVANGSVATLFNSGADAPLSYSLLTDTSGLPALTSNGVAVTYNVVGNTLTASAGGNTVFTFTVNANGNWTFTLVDQIDHPTLNGQPGDNTENDLTIALGSIIQATDRDGDSVTANANGLVITIDDDTPVANNDTDSIPGGGDITTGNVITGAGTDSGVAGADSPGADAPASITRLASNNVPANFDATGPFVVVGQYGTLTMQANGDYSYDRADGAPGNVQDVFTYTYTDADGDSVTATLTIGIADSAPVLPDPAAVLLDDDALANGNPGGTGDDPNSQGTPGQLVGSGGDGDLDYFFTGSNTLPAGFTVNAAGLPGSIQILQGATVVLTVTLNNETGAFTVVQNNPIVHPAGLNENNVSFSIGVEVRDADNDAEPATITINVDDDTPTATATLLTGTVDEDGVPGGIAGGTGDVAGESTVVNGSVASLFASGADTPLTYSLLSNTAGLPALTSGGVAVTYSVVGNTLTASAGGNTVFTFVLNANGTYTFTLVDQLDHAAGNNENDLSIALGSIIQATDNDGDSVTANANGLVITVDDDTPVAANDTDTIAAGSFGPATGNVITDAAAGDAGDSDTGADGSGADAPAQITGLASNNIPANVDNNPAGGFVVIGQYGTLTLQADGSYSYARAAGTPGGVNDVFTYTLTDADGDSVTATLTISIADATPTLPDPAAVLLDDDALAGGNAGGTGDDVDSAGTPGTLLGTGGDGDLDYAFTGANTLPAGFSVNVVNAGQIQILQGVTVVLTVTLDTETGGYTVVQNNPIDHAALLDENNTSFGIGVQVVDVDGDTEPATITINVDDDTPVNFTPVDLTDTDGSTATTQDDALVNDGTANVTRLINDANNDGTGENFIGADGFGSLTFTATGHTNGEQLESTGGTPLTSGGDPIYVFGFGTGTLTATTSADNSDPSAVVFTATLSPNAGYGSASTYTIDFNQSIDDGGGFVFDDFSTAPAGQNDWVGLDADGFDINDPLDPNANSEDLLLTPTNAGGSINTSSTDIGNSNQWVDSGEGVRLDYVIDVRRDPGMNEKDVGGYAFDGHYNVTDSSFTIMQTQGGGTASVRITAFNDPDTAPLDTLGGSIVAIDPASIVVTGDATYTVTVMPDGSVVVSGLAAGASVEFETIGDVVFNSYSVTNANGVANPNGGTFTSDAFALGVFGFNSETQGNPIDLQFDVTATDGDGDTSSGTIDVTLAPEAIGSLAATSFASQEEQVQKSAANSNTLTVAAAVGAAGMAESAAAAPSDGESAQHNTVESMELAADDGSAPASVEGGNDSSSVAALPEADEAEPAPGNSGGRGEGNAKVHDAKLDDGANHQAANDHSADQAANDQGPAAAADAHVAAAPTVMMASAEALKAAGLDGNANQGGDHASPVEQVVAEALGHGAAPTVDALLASLGNGEVGALHELTSPAFDNAPAWDMGANGSFANAADMLIKMGADMAHHDAVQPAVNG